ncbi:MAG: hypothetical protein R3212_02200, partial [Xanthomonadales bacterium]|nr:hypothetical protein [Xanthomonadales bacterium]
MNIRNAIAALFLSITGGSVILASDVDYRSEYVGQEQRLIKSLSPDDQVALKTGGGWGLAKSAELNGLPGPLHLLQMSDEIGLSGAQQQAIQDIYDAMKA